jgi:hypothetical protein
MWKKLTFGPEAIAESSPTKARKPALDYVFRWFAVTPVSNPAVPELPTGSGYVSSDGNGRKNRVLLEHADSRTR